jgi:metal-responsive CopG/Arc/MetJ family transcriptional regulator
MARAATKVAVNIPDELYRILDRVRRARGKTLSAAIQEALRHWLDHEAQLALVREYEAGYRRKPEGRREVKAAEAAAIRLVTSADW